MPSHGELSLEDLRTIQEAADLVRVHPATIRNWLRDKKIKRIKAGSRTLLSMRDLEAFVKSSTEASERDKPKASASI